MKSTRTTDKAQCLITAPIPPKKETVIKHETSSQHSISTISGEKKFSKISASINSTQLYQFLINHKVEKGQPFTHTSIGAPCGSYYIPIEEKEQLIDLLEETIFHKHIPVHLTEKPPENNMTNLKVDLDFKFPLDENNRHYTFQHVSDITMLYHIAIKNYLDLDDNQLQAFIFERDTPYKDRSVCKDGIHIIYPYVICNTQIQYLIRDYVLLYCHPIIDSIHCDNSVEDVVDKSIIATNNWLLYGCSKPVAKPYHLSRILNSQLEEVDDFDMNEKQLIGLFSIRDHPESSYIPIKTEHAYLLKPKQTTKKKLIIKNTTEQTTCSISPSNLSNINEIEELIHMLNPDRANTYKTWIELGWCLHNIDPSLLYLWIEFSQKSNKFVDGECQREWIKMKSDGNGLKLGSLHRWARIDNPQGYSEYKRTNLDHYITKSQSQTTYDIACVVHYLYKYQYVYVSGKSDIWYEFKQHRWQPVDGLILFKKLNETIVKEYLRLITYYNQTAYNQGDGEKDQYLQKAKNLTDITYKLRDYTFKHKIIGECKVLFLDGTFMSKLDTNPYLIGFENGVYDLKEGCFREGQPEDYISLSTGINYQTFPEDDEKVVRIYEFMSQIFVNTETRDYVFTLLSSFLEGVNPQEKFHIWTGSGGNGKSKLLELFGLAFGQYANKIPVSTLTQKRTQSGALAPEIVRLRNSRTVSTQEPENDSLNAGIIKDLTGGDTLVQRGLYADCIEFKPKFKIIFCCNKLPSVPHDDGGIWRRISVVDFKSKFVDHPDSSNPYEFQKDCHLSEKFYEWKEPFMYILLEHYKLYAKSGLIEPPEVKNAINDYHLSVDIYQNFIDNHLEKSEDPDDYVTMNHMWCIFRNKHGNIKRKDFVNSIIKIMGSPIKDTVIKRKHEKNLYRNVVFVHDQPANVGEILGNQLD